MNKCSRLANVCYSQCVRAPYMDFCNDIYKWKHSTGPLQHTDRRTNTKILFKPPSHLLSSWSNPSRYHTWLCCNAQLAGFPQKMSSNTHPGWSCFSSCSHQPCTCSGHYTSGGLSSSKTSIIYLFYYNIFKSCSINTINMNLVLKIHTNMRVHLL